MLTREQVLEHHSPAVWFLATTGAAFTGILVATAVWNAWEYRSELLDVVVRHLDRLHPQ